MDSSEAEPNRKPRRRKLVGPLPHTAPDAYTFKCELTGGPFDGLVLMVLLPLPDELDLLRYGGGPCAHKHFYRRGVCTRESCTYIHDRAIEHRMFQSGDDKGAKRKSRD